MAQEISAYGHRVLHCLRVVLCSSNNNDKGERRNITPLTERIPRLLHFYRDEQRDLYIYACIVIVDEHRYIAINNSSIVIPIAGLINLLLKPPRKSALLLRKGAKREKKTSNTIASYRSFFESCNEQYNHDLHIIEISAPSARAEQTMNGHVCP